MPDNGPRLRDDPSYGDVVTLTFNDGSTKNLSGVQESVQLESIGDLGSRFRPTVALSLEVKALRNNASQMGYRSFYNHRFQGPREPFKFNFAMQALLNIAANMFNTLQTSYDAFKVNEQLYYPTSAIDPDDSEVALIYHTRIQITFKEWLLLKPANKKWFV